MKRLYTLLPACALALGLAAADPYPVNYEDGTTITNAARYTSSATLTSGYGTFVVPVSQQEDRLLYHSAMDAPMVVKPGETVHAALGYSAAWMNTYVYIDLDNDGQFDPETELLSYSHLGGKNSAGATVGGNTAVLPDFEIPASTANGVYRIRFKVDWDSNDPGGSTVQGNTITANGGVIIDAPLVVTKAGSMTMVMMQCEPDRVLNADGKSFASILPGMTGQPFKALPDRGNHLAAMQLDFGFSTLEPKNGNPVNFQIELTDGLFRNEGVIPAYAFCGDLTVITPLFEAGENPDPNAKDGYQLVWNDEFNGADGTEADMVTRWNNTPSYSGVAWNRYRANRADLRCQRNGSLILTAKENDGLDPTETRPWITGAIQSSSKFAFTYGYTEARVRCPWQAGSFPAYWMMPQNSKGVSWPDCGEIDIWEQANPNGRAWHTIHGPWNNGGSGGITANAYAVDYGQWHTFGLEWTPDYLEWFCDGISRFKIEKNSSRIGGTWPFDDDFYIILNQSVGNGGFAGNPVDGTVYTLEVDYVRVYQKEGCHNIGGMTYEDEYYSGIDTTVADGDAAPRYYDLQGRPVAAPAHRGIYIEQRGADTRKVIL